MTCKSCKKNKIKFLIEQNKELKGLLTELKIPSNIVNSMVSAISLKYGNTVKGYLKNNAKTIVNAYINSSNGQIPDEVVKNIKALNESLAKEIIEDRELTNSVAKKLKPPKTNNPEKGILTVLEYTSNLLSTQATVANYLAHIVCFEFAEQIAFAGIQGLEESLSKQINLSKTNEVKIPIKNLLKEQVSDEALNLNIVSKPIKGAPISWDDLLHTGLDVVGFIEVPTPLGATVGMIADGINMSWYAAEGNAIGALTSALGMAIPVLGDAFKLGKWIKYTPDEAVEIVVKNSDSVIKFLQKSKSRLPAGSQRTIDELIEHFRRMGELKKDSPEKAFEYFKNLMFGSEAKAAQYANKGRIKKSVMATKIAAKSYTKAELRALMSAIDPAKYTGVVFVTQVAMYAFLTSEMGIAFMSRVLDLGLKPVQVIAAIARLFVDNDVDRFIESLKVIIELMPEEERAIRFEVDNVKSSIKYGELSGKPRCGVREISVLLGEKGSKERQMYPNGVCYNTASNKATSYLTSGSGKAFLENKIKIVVTGAQVLNESASKAARKVLTPFFRNLKKTLKDATPANVRSIGKTGPVFFDTPRFSDNVTNALKTIETDKSVLNKLARYNEIEKDLRSLAVKYKGHAEVQKLNDFIATTFTSERKTAIRTAENEARAASKAAPEAAPKAADDVKIKDTPTPKPSGIQKFLNSKAAKVLFMNRYYATSVACHLGGLTVGAASTIELFSRATFGKALVMAPFIAAVNTIVNYYLMKRAAGEAVQPKPDSFIQRQFKSIRKAGVTIKDVTTVSDGALAKSVATGAICYFAGKEGLKDGLVVTGLGQVMNITSQKIQKEADNYKLNKAQKEEIRLEVSKVDSALQALILRISPTVIPLWTIKSIVNAPGDGGLEMFYSKYDRLIDELDLLDTASKAVDAAAGAFTAGVTKRPVDIERAEAKGKKLIKRIPTTMRANIKFAFSIFKFQYYKNKSTIDNFKIEIKKEQYTGANAYLMCLFSTKVPAVLSNRIFKAGKEFFQYLSGLGVEKIPTDVLKTLAELLGEEDAVGEVTDATKRFLEIFIKFADFVAQNEIDFNDTKAKCKGKLEQTEFFKYPKKNLYDELEDLEQEETTPDATEPPPPKSTKKPELQYSKDPDRGFKGKKGKYDD